MFQVSVIIPVYNAVLYIERAVNSVIALTEVAEIILVDDGYSDGSLELCKHLQQKFDKIKLFQHPNGENRGAGASRNLGIKNAKFNFIAFLDADDYYLPNRFINTQKLFDEDALVSAVYEPVGTEYLNETARDNFCKFKDISKEESYNYISYPLKPLYGEDFFYSLIAGTNSYPHTNGITIKKEIFDKAGLFNEKLRLHQDTELWIRIAYYGKFASPAGIEPVSIRCVHEENRINNVNYQSQFLLVSELKKWADTVKLKKKYKKLFLKRYVNGKIRKVFNANNVMVKSVYRIYYFLILLLNPKYW